MRGELHSNQGEAISGIFDEIATMLRSSQGIVAWINFTSVIPWLDHGIQLKILKLLVFFIVFMDPVVK
ncbi:MAG: hypothetical protein ACEY3D_07005, partial [Rickettsia sp.]|uniref:hypothetical protein n=1 Tax=Rickettsia sp. TaxID=789 RepID=UPI00397C823B